MRSGGGGRPKPEGSDLTRASSCQAWECSYASWLLFDIHMPRRLKRALALFKPNSQASRRIAATNKTVMTIPQERSRLHTCRRSAPANPQSCSTLPPASTRKPLAVTPFRPSCADRLRYIGRRRLTTYALCAAPAPRPVVDIDEDRSATRLRAGTIRGDVQAPLRPQRFDLVIATTDRTSSRRRAALLRFASPQTGWVDPDRRAEP